jgi:hypothetical protein
MRHAVFAALSASLLAAPALAQQAPDVGVNYKGKPFVYDLLERLRPMPELVAEKKNREALKTCETEMRRVLATTGLAERGKAAYRACAARLSQSAPAPSTPAPAPEQ